jgi:NAD(P)-dependent dehydrogenase (short-subunit alcohol dehydrogenase family)
VSEDNPSKKPAPLASDDLATRILEACALLESIADDRTQLSTVDEPTRRRLSIAAGRVSLPDRTSARSFRKAMKKRDSLERKRADEVLLEATGIRTARRNPIFITPSADIALLPAKAPSDEGATSDEELRDARKCYVCKAEFTRVHAFYDQMCGRCGELNWAKRTQTADLRGRVALITGSRVKIGYHAAIKLLRAGAHVIVTTRFPADAATRYAREPDFEAFRDRLEVYGLDLRHTPSVETFAEHVKRKHTHLDYLINNACQTVRRPAGFYRHLMDNEHRGLDGVGAEARPLLAGYEALRRERQRGLTHARDDRSSGGDQGDVGIVSAAALSQVPLLEEDRGEDFALFPAGKLDADLQQVDLRARNSWRLGLSEVPTIELLEVQLVNAIAPFVLNARLRPLMRLPTRDAHIVNVSAMEGQFYRAWKTDKHPHTNMAKAALNMLTRTSASECIVEGIHMNSVDTGWITDEDPAEISARKVEEHGFSPPLDVVDGAARIIDPIFDGVNTGDHKWGLFLKDYVAVPW